MKLVLSFIVSLVVIECVQPIYANVYSVAVLTTLLYLSVKK